MFTDAQRDAVLPEFSTLLGFIFRMAFRHKADGMVALTHGQPAVSTTFGKELSVYAARLNKFAAKLKKFQFEGKLNGAVGNYNALAFAFPKIGWLGFSRKYISSLGLKPNLITTQIIPADAVVEYGLLLYQINTILIGFCQDIWMYISRGVVKQMKDKNQIGSSTMPQKVNPIYFENAEGNLQIANSLFELFARKFPVSRMQRDLSDSTVKRTVGSAVAYTLIAWKSLQQGLTKITFDTEAAAEEMNDHWEMLAEAMQIYFKLHGDAKGYEKVKKLLMGKRLDAKTYQLLARTYPPLANLSPATYIGLAEKLTLLALKKS
jgi:adenylosuccinate lyase